MQRRKFLALVNAFAALDTVLMEHLEKCAKNTKAVPWQIQNDKIEFLSQLVRSKIEHGYPDYYVIIVDEFTGRFSNKVSLLLCLRYLRFWANKKTSAKHFAIFPSKKWNRPF